SIIVACILVFGTILTGRNASRDTEMAVHAVSLFYLDELAERREQVVASTLQGYINDLDVAIGLIEKEDLTSLERLQAYQARMKQLYNLEKFAFVNNEGLIYTSRGTRIDIDNYHFDYHNLSGPEISLKNPDSANKKIVVAMPLDRLPFQGKYLVVCFMEFDMNRMLKGISLQSSNSGTTFCNIYTNEGQSLTNVVLGGLASENNLLKALKDAEFVGNKFLPEMQDNFKNKQAGVVSFIYNGIRETMCYVPIHGTDWMLTYLVRESVITEQISSIYEGIVARSLTQSVLTVFVLAGMFAVMILQMRRAAKVTLEKEISETASRVKQQELQEQLALQEQLLAQEKQRVQQDRMITALASDYRSVYYVNLDDNTGVCYRRDAVSELGKKEGEVFPFHEVFTEYAYRFVAKEYREGFLAFITKDAICKGLESNIVLAYRYLIERDGHQSYEMLRVARVNQSEEGDNAKIRAIGVGFTDIDSEMRDSMQKSQALSDALKAAEEASRAKTVFLSNMSHEIRTPMNAIIGLDNLALNEPNLPLKTKDYLKKIGSSAQHLLSLINDILDMSRIESGRIVIRNEEFAFSKLLEQINMIFSGQCQEKGLTYNCHIIGQIDDYYIGDNIKLRQVLINILGNAVKFTPAGGSIEFLVEKTAGFDNRSTLRFTVKDTGIGMSKEFLPKLFDSFSQEDSRISNKYGSTGLGMAITKNIIEMMNGTIEVESEKGVGSTFTVVVTLMDSKKILDGEAGDIEINPQEMVVLVIDDDPVACQHAQLVLEKAGIASEMALTGAEALEKVKLRHARREPYNLIIIDWQMPEMDGVEATRKIREIIGNETAIIILTAYHWDDVMEEAIAAGVDSFIAKPLFSGNLLEEFKNALRRKKIKKSEESIKKADLAGRRILLAEDMIVNAEIMVEVLKMREMEVEHAENGKIAVEMFSSHPAGYYAAILMDMRMPEMNGLEATVAIRAMERPDAKTIPIIALTANAFDEDVQRSLQAGLNAHLSKPVNPEVLFDTLENMIK
ncbi:MAG: response regulator, partial [Desulfovibrionaceae bacterium]|nr:response regulator [Desulfovibrionaceae bacterium]